MTNVCSINKVSYPDEIRSAGGAAGLHSFAESIVSRRFLVDAIDRVGRLLASGLEGTTMRLIGSAGAGKSLPGELACCRINRGFFGPRPDDRHTVPAAPVEAWAAESIRFHWHDFHVSLLVALQTPSTTAVLPQAKRSIAAKDIFLPGVSRPAVRTLRARVRRAIVMRQSCLLFVDEATNILMSPRNERVKWQADSQRPVANRAGSAPANPYRIDALPRCCHVRGAVPGGRRPVHGRYY